MIYRSPTGELTAPDGWVLRWNLRRATDQEIVIYSADGVRQGVFSGDIGREGLEREIATFLQSHSGQATLW